MRPEGGQHPGLCQTCPSVASVREGADPRPERDRKIEVRAIPSVPDEARPQRGVRSKEARGNRR